MTSTSIDVLAGLSSGAAIKVPVRVATTANITLSGLQTIDGVTVAVGDRVLVKNQTNTTQNGIYDAAASTWARSQDFDGARDAVKGTTVFVTSGTLSANVFYQVTTADPIVIGTSALVWSAGSPLTSPVPIAQGGTNAITAAAARANLGIDASSTVASASTTDLGATTGRCVDISGVTTITSFGTTAAGVTRKCRISGAGLTLTHSGNLICPGSVSLVLTQFDQFEAESYGSGIWAIISVLRTGGDPTMGWATKATQQAATDAVRSVTPAQQGNHLSAPKAYGIVASAGSAVVGGYPSSASSVKNGTGDYSITLGVTMANTNYIALLTVEAVNTSAYIVSRTQTALRVAIFVTATGAAVDGNLNYAVFGTLA